MLKNSSKKIVGLKTLECLRQKNHNSKVVHCHGVFDVLHIGHLTYFQSAKKFGDLVVVTITADEFVNKGPGRPYFTSYVRAQMVAALELVDYVAINQFETAVPAIEIIKPHFYIKGPDYKDKSTDITGAIYKEELAVQKNGGKLVFSNDEVFSSSHLINKFFNPLTEAQQHAIDQVKQAGGLEKIMEVLKQIEKERVIVIGEPIVDTYRFCLPESISSKSPSISAHFLYEENYAGGSLAVANHFCDFVSHVDLLMTHGDEPYFKDVLDSKLDQRVNVFELKLANIPTPRKIRYIVQEKSQRIFEITDLRYDQWLQHSPDIFCNLIKDHAHKEKIKIIADFGHGLFETHVTQQVSSLEGFVACNVQTNSSNFVYNPITKYNKFSYLSADTKEMRVAYHDRLTAPLDLAVRFKNDLKASNKNSCFAMTLGPNGSCYFPVNSDENFFAPAFADHIVDATGAGDAYFLLTSLLVKADCPSIMIPFLGNVFAGLKTKILGNKSFVRKSQFVKALTSLLK